MNPLTDKLLGALVGLARASESKEISDSAGAAFIDGLAMAHALAFETTASSSQDSIQASSFTHGTEQFSFLPAPSAEEILAMIDRLHEEKKLMAPDCAACQYPCGRTFDYDMEETYGASEALREAKLNLLAALGKIALREPVNASKEVRQFLSDSLFQISCTYEPGQLAEPLNTAKKLLDQHT